MSATSYSDAEVSEVEAFLLFSEEFLQEFEEKKKKAEEGQEFYQEQVGFIFEAPPTHEDSEDTKEARESNRDTILDGLRSEIKGIGVRV
jgi:hypothetical protein